MKPGPGAGALRLPPPPPPAPPPGAWPLGVGALLLALAALATAAALAEGAMPGATPARYHIRPRPCAAAGGDGTCMFVWECLRAGGKPLGVCVDHFMFGSCCADAADAGDAADAAPTPEDNAVEGADSHTHPHAHANKDTPAVLALHGAPSITQLQQQADSTPAGMWVRPPPPPPPPLPAANAAPATPGGSAGAWRPPPEPTFVTRPRPPPPPPPPPPRPPPPLPPRPPPAPAPVLVLGTATSSWMTHTRPSSKPTAKPTTRPTTTTGVTTTVLQTTRPATRPRPRPTRRPTTTTTTPSTTTSTSTTSTPSTTTTTTTTTAPPTTTTTAPSSAVPASSSSSTTEGPGPGPTSTLAGVSAIQAQDTPCGVAPLMPRPETRIVGGKNAPFGGWPWQVSVRRTSFFGFSSTHRCGGALLNEAWVATAGHCVDDLLTSQIRVRLGEHDFASATEPLPMVERGVARKVVHPRYNFFTYEFDLALLRLEPPALAFAPHIAPVCLPASDDLLVGENATVTGWGRLSEGGALPSVLQEVAVPIVSNDKCKMMFLKAGRHEFIPDIFLCAGHETGGQDSCQGDSGGPLQVRGRDGRYFLAGIISWGIGCAEANLPGVCTRISKFVPWILENVQS